VHNCACRTTLPTLRLVLVPPRRRHGEACIVAHHTEYRPCPSSAHGTLAHLRPQVCEYEAQLSSVKEAQAASKAAAGGGQDLEQEVQEAFEEMNTQRAIYDKCAHPLGVASCSSIRKDHMLPAAVLFWVPLRHHRKLHSPPLLAWRYPQSTVCTREPIWFSVLANQKTTCVVDFTAAHGFDMRDRLQMSSLRRAEQSVMCPLHQVPCRGGRRARGDEEDQRRARAREGDAGRDVPAHAVAEVGQVRQDEGLGREQVRGWRSFLLCCSMCSSRICCDFMQAGSGVFNECWSCHQRFDGN